MKTIKEVIDETVALIQKNGRSMDYAGDCVYTSTEDPDCHCAVGHWLKPEFQTAEWVANEEGFSEYIQTCLREEVQHIPKAVWVELQTLHDREHYWSSSGLTKDGEYILQKIHYEWKDHEHYEDTNTKHIR